MLRRQRGALLFITPLILTIIALFSVMALDGARLYGVRDALQSQANAAASAGAEATQACGGTDISVDTMKARALVAAQAQGFTGTVDDLDLRVGLLVPDPDNPDQVLFQAVNDVAASNAVRIELTSDEPISRLLPQSILGTVTLSASSAVRKEVRASLSVAGSTLGVSGGLVGSLLGALFGDPDYSLDPTSLQSLSGTLVELGELLSLLGVDTLEDALPLGATELAAILRGVVGNATPVGDMLDRLIGVTGISTLSIGDVLTAVGDVGVDDENPIELLGLVTSLLLNVIEEQQVLTGTALSLPNLGLGGLPSSVDTLSVNLYVFKAPQYVANIPARKNLDGDWEGVFYAPDISLEVAVNVKIPLVAEVRVPLAVDLGGGDGYLSSAMCARGANNDVQFGMRLNRQVLKLATGTIDPENGNVVPEPLVISVLSLPGISLLNIEADISGEIPGESADVMIEPNYPLFCSPEEGCSRITRDDSGAGLAGLHTDIDIEDLSLLGLDLSGLLNPILNPILDLLAVLTDGLMKIVVSPLLKLLGVGVGGMSVTVVSADQDYTQLIENVGLANGGQPL